MAFFAQYFVLSGKDALYGAHQGTAFAGQVAVNFFTEIGFEKVTAADGDTERYDAFLCFAGGVLEDGVAAVETAALEEHSSQGGAGAFWRYEEYVDVFWRDDAGLFVKGNAEAMGEIEGFARGEVFFYRGPQGDLGGVAQEVADDGAFLKRFFYLEQGLAGYESVADGLVPGFGVLALTDYDIDTIIFLIQRLAGALHAVADDGHYFIF